MHVSSDDNTNSACDASPGARRDSLHRCWNRVCLARTVCRAVCQRLPPLTTSPRSSRFYPHVAGGEAEAWEASGLTAEVRARALGPECRPSSHNPLRLAVLATLPGLSGPHVPPCRVSASWGGGRCACSRAPREAFRRQSRRARPSVPAAPGAHPTSAPDPHFVHILSRAPSAGEGTEAPAGKMTRLGPHSQAAAEPAPVTAPLCPPLGCVPAPRARGPGPHSRCPRCCPRSPSASPRSDPKRARRAGSRPWPLVTYNFGKVLGCSL